MDERFVPIEDGDVVFRLAETGSSFLPDGRLLPLPAWLRPSSDDRDEAKLRGRVAGLSVWDRARTTVPQARHLSGKAKGLAFRVSAGNVRDVGRRHDVSLDVVRDPLFDRVDEPGWGGHALVEGLDRPDGQPKKRYKDLRAELAEAFAPCD